MTKGMYICLLVVMVLTVLVGCGDTPPAVSEPSIPSTNTTTTTTTTTTTLPQGARLDTLTFTGRVLEVEADGSAVLMECYGNSPLGDRVWVQLGGIADLTPQVGEEYKVTYEDMVMLSLPPRINAVTMILVFTAE